MTRPFKGSASVTHPLLGEAVTQFQAQAYKELLPSDGPVRAKVVGNEDDSKANQAQRVQEFMNYMITEKNGRVHSRYGPTTILFPSHDR